MHAFFLSVLPAISHEPYVHKFNEQSLFVQVLSSWYHYTCRHQKSDKITAYEIAITMTNQFSMGTYSECCMMKIGCTRLPHLKWVLLIFSSFVLLKYVCFTKSVLSFMVRDWSLPPPTKTFWLKSWPILIVLKFWVRTLTKPDMVSVVSSGDLFIVLMWAF